MAVSANFGNMVSMALATPFLPFLPMAAKQILVNNLLADLPSMAISTDRVDSELISHPERWDLREVQRFMLVFGLLSTVFDLLTFWVLLPVLHADEAHFQTSWFMVSLLTELAAVSVLRTKALAWQSRPGPLLGAGLAVVAAVALALPYSGPVAKTLGFVGLDGATVAVLLGLVIAYWIANEVTKRVYYHHYRKKRLNQ
jgi:Mg2+-importing ATPase